MCRLSTTVHLKTKVFGRTHEKLFMITAVSVLSVTTAFAETAPGSVSFEDGSVIASLTGVAGDAAAGRNTFKIASRAIVLHVT